MNPDSPRGRYRYVLTRPCLDRGSLSVLRYLEPALPLNGHVVFIGDAGEEVTGTADPVSRRIYGLSDYYAKHRLGVNDVLYITVLGERRYQLESAQKNRDDKPAEEKRAPAPPAPPQRVIVEESPYVREIRVSPYPRGLMYPQNDRAAPETTPAPADTTTQARAADAPVEAVARRTSPRDATPAPRNAPPATTPRPAPPQVAPQPAATAHVETRTEARPADRPRHRPELRRAGVIDPVRRQFETLGYGTETLPDDAVLAVADLGRRSYRAVIATTDAAPTAERWAALLTLAAAREATYLAVVAPEAVLEHLDVPADARSTFKGRVTLVAREALDGLATLRRLAPVGPLELEGYWNAGSITRDTLDSLEASAAHEIAARGAFSFTALSLSRFPAQTVVNTAQVIAGVDGSGITEAAIRETLETLARAPFMLLTPMGGGEYLLRQDVSEALANLSEYAASLRSRLRLPSQQPAARAAVDGVTVRS